ncbi:molybdopterin-dependent oxidoreductase [Maritalea myrionectae]|uniref:molybdopterin-dependent oxidoreductase n=1 Tax=Maritalea myrionectae TaxID=454601 RepID=UPI00040A625E|nr:molybdopterin-dependent oxidoreductase [Maritalea myrionectae]
MNLKPKKLFVVLTTMFLAFAPLSSIANEEKVILTIDGEIAGSEPRYFTLKQLEALGMDTIVTTTPWHDGKQTFEGVPLVDLMEHVGASGDSAYVVALNNYSTEIPIEDFSKHGVILASRKNGQAMPVSNKGPLFVIYPYDSDKFLKTELYYTRSAWQVRTITIE